MPEGLGGSILPSLAQTVNFLPVIERELKLRSRRWGTYLFRMFVAGAGMLIILMATIERHMRPQEQSLVMLVGCAVIGMVVTQLSGCFFTADCISSEKREGTLGLLFLTPLKARDIVIGKLASHSVLIFFGILALGPVLFIPLLNGGVTAAQTVRLFVGITVSLFLSLSVGIWMSAIGREAKSTVVGTLVVLVLLNGLPLIYIFLGVEVFGVRDLSPFGPPQLAPWALVLFAIEEMTQQFGLSLFWGAICAQTLMAFGALGGAWLTLARIARSGDFESKAKSGTRKRGFWKGIVHWAMRPSVSRVGPLGDARPYQWLAERGWLESAWQRWFRRFLWFGFLTTYVPSLFAPRFKADDYLVVAFWFIAALHFFTKLQMAFESSRQISADHKQGCLELVLCTPLDARMVVEGAGRAARRACDFQFQLLAAVNVAVWVSLLLFGRRYGIRGDELGLFSIALLGGAVAAWLDSRVMLRLGAYLALVRKTHLKAALTVMLLVVAAPWVVVLLALLAGAFGRINEEGVMAILLVWFVGCFVWNACLDRKMRAKLDSGFRDLAVGSA